MNKNKEIAEFVGIFLGDGNFYSNGRNEQLRICLNSRETQFSEYVSGIMYNIFKKQPGRYINNKTEIIIYCYGKEVGAKLRKMGLKPGRKSYGIPKWILKNKELMKACVRGLIDTDGSIYRRSNSKNIPQLFFSSQTPEIIQDFRYCMKKLNFRISNICKKRTTPACGLYALEEVKKYAETIGFKNTKHKK